MNPQIIPIFYACNNQTAGRAAKSIGSLAGHTSPGCSYRVHILSGGLTGESKRLLCAPAGPQLEVLFEDDGGDLDAFAESLPLGEEGIAAYFRFLIAPRFLQYQKALYLDCDAVVQEDVSPLFATDLGERYLAACHSQFTWQNDLLGTYCEGVLGISRRQYFSAGVLVINCQAFRSHRLFEKFAGLAGVYQFRAMRAQDYLNLVCKDHVLYLDPRWNTEVYKDVTNPYPPEQAFILRHPAEAEGELLQAAKAELAREDNYQNLLNKTVRAADRVAVTEKIAEFEREGKFDVDVEQDPPGRQIQPGEIDYLRRSLAAKIKTRIAYSRAKKFLRYIKKHHYLIIREIRGIENLKNLQSGAVVTCNHFNAFDSFAMHEVYAASGHKKRALYRVIREGNYTSFPGFYGFLMRHFYTLPLSSNAKTMQKFIKATDQLLQRGNFVLFYPEQSMWWNYRKPKPLKPGAYRFAVKNKVPVVPCFITMRDSEYPGADGYPIQEYTITVGAPIYPQESLSYKDNIQYLMDENFAAWKTVYEKEYDMPLEYTTQPENQ